MPRLITAKMAQALRDRLPIALLAEVDHPDGLVHFWTGIGTLSYNGFDWTGAGTLGQITPVKRTNDLAIQEVQLQLTGVPPNVGTWLNANVRNREATAWLACVKGARIIPDPYELVRLVMDFQTFSIDGDTAVATIVINALSGFYTLERAIDEIWSDQDQKTRFPTDTGFNQLTLLQNQEVKWTVS